jgi:hypothetical protein
VVIANSYELLATLNTSLDENHKVIKLTERTLLLLRLDLFERHIIRISIIPFKPLIVRNEEESSSSKVNNMTLVIKSVRFGIILNVKSV